MSRHKIMPTSDSGGLLASSALRAKLSKCLRSQQRSCVGFSPNTNFGSCREDLGEQIYSPRESPAPFKFASILHPQTRLQIYLILGLEGEAFRRQETNCTKKPVQQSSVCSTSKKQKQTYNHCPLSCLQVSL